MIDKLVKKSRSIRSYDRTKKPDAKTLASLAELCRYTPSTANLQALKFAAVSEPEKCEEIFKATKWAGYITDEKIPPSGHEPTAFIIIFIDGRITANTALFYKDTGICAQTIMLAAAEIGLGGCMIGSFDAEAIKKILGTDEALEPSLVLALGYPDEKPQIVDAEGDIKYYRKNRVNYVPKRKIEDIVTVYP